MTKETDEMKYEGLAALIIEGQRHAKERHENFKQFVDHRFSGLEKHNEKQNGAISETINRVTNLEHGNKYSRFLKWIDMHPRRSIIVVFASWFVVSTIVTNAVVNNWMPKFWDLVIKIVT